MESFYNYITVFEGGGYDWTMYQVNYVAKPTFS